MFALCGKFAQGLNGSSAAVRMAKDSVDAQCSNSSHPARLRCLFGAQNVARRQTFAACRLPKNSKILGSWSCQHSKVWPGLSCGSDHCLAVLRRVGSRKQVLLFHRFFIFFHLFSAWPGTLVLGQQRLWPGWWNDQRGGVPRCPAAASQRDTRRGAHERRCQNMEDIISEIF